MTTMIDINNIIMPLNNSNNNISNNNISNIIENYINNNMNTYSINTYSINHIIYSNIDKSFDSIIMTDTIKYLNNYIKKQKHFFSDYNKKNKFKLADVNIFINTFYKLVTNINRLIIHLKINSNITNHLKINSNITNIEKPWGSTHLIITSFQNLCILLNDNIIQIALHKSIVENVNNKKNTEMFKFIHYIKILNNYNNNIQFSILNIIDNILNNTLPDVKHSITIDTNLLQVYKFKYIYEYYVDNIKKYYYINNYYINNIDNTKICPILKKIFPLLKQQLIKQLEQIINIIDIDFVKNFINEYKNILIGKYFIKDIYNIIIVKHIENFDIFLEYYGMLFDILSNNKDIILRLLDWIYVYINKNTYNDDTIMLLVDKITFNIENDKSNEFLYMIGSRMNNRDSLIKNLYYKLMFRIIYGNSLDDEFCKIEASNYIKIQTYFNIKDYYHYTVVMNDLFMTVKNISKCISADNNNMKMIITTLNTWKINTSGGYINQNKFNNNNNNKLLKDMHTIIEHHKTVTSELLIYPQNGMIDCNIALSKHNSNIIMTPLHMMCLENFTNINVYHTYKYLETMLKQNITASNDKLIEQIIHSFVIGKILLVTDDTINIYKNIFYLNDNMPLSVNLIEIYHDISNSDIIIKQQITNELIHERCEIIMCNINSIIKQNNNNINNDSCYIKCKENITLFEIDRNMYEDAIKKMEIKDLIIRCDNKLEIIV